VEAAGNHESRHPVNAKEEVFPIAKRAMTNEAKAIKAQAILDKAREMFLAADYGKIKMSDIAKAMGISNGILFVYYKTKETLFLNIFWQEYEKRLNCLKELAAKEKIESFDDIKKLFLTELELLVDNNILYIRLESMRAAIFEKNTDSETLRNMKRSLFEQTIELARIIGDTGLLSKEEVIDILLIEDAIVVGCGTFADLISNVAPITDRLGADEFQRYHKEYVLYAVGCCLDGFRYKSSHESVWKIQ
jgi:AcrR family transcriptional regulator